MAKDKKGGLTNKHLHTRIAYLHSAATYLATQNPTCTILSQASYTTSVSTKPHSRFTNAQPYDVDTNEASSDHSKSKHFTSSGGLPLYLTYHLRQVAQKAQIRLTSGVKTSLCKTCNEILVEGKSSKKYVENLSYQSAKPHADVMVLECCLCSTKKRFPIGAKRQAKKARRADLMAIAAGKARIDVPAEEG